MAILGRFTKQPTDVLDYQFDFAAWLADRADTIVGVPTITVAPYKAVPVSTVPLVVATVTTSLGIVHFFASGGTDKCVYELTCTFTTNGGRTKQAEILLTVKET